MHLPKMKLAALAGLILSSAVPAAACDSARRLEEAVSEDIAAFARSSGKRILTFAGYSAAGYEDPAAMLAAAGRVLDEYAPAQTLVNIGATADGIGAVYELAKARGFVTIGIVSSLARDEKARLSPCVDRVFFVRDASWGGRLPGSEALAPTSAAIVANSTVFVAIGGGDIARDEMRAARAAGREVRFIPADMNHRQARAKARQQGRPEPNDFRGTARDALAGGS